MNFFLTLSFLVIFQTSFSQFDNFTSLESKGEIPLTLLQYLNIDVNQLEGKSDDEIQKHLIIGELLKSGLVTFGDDVSQHINRIAKEILKNKPELLNKLTFLTFKSNSASSFSTETGLVFINTGFIGQIIDEEQLAFIIAHEIGHFLEKHKNYPYLNFTEANIDRIEYTQIKQKINFDTFTIRTIDEKLKADSIALNLLSDTKYNNRNFSLITDVILYSYLPFDEIPFNFNILNCDSSFVIDNSLISDKNITINPLEVENPNRHLLLDQIKKRNEFLKSHVNLNIENPNYFCTSKEDFEKVKLLAQFDIINCNLSNRKYIEALYQANCLLINHPENKFIKRSILKALYGITIYKINNRQDDIQATELQLQGELTTLKDFFDTLTKDQSAVVTLVNIKKYLNEYPDDIFVKNLQYSLISNMSKLLNMEMSNFRNKRNSTIPEQKKIDVKNELELTKYETIKKNKLDISKTIGSENFHFFIKEIISKDSLIAFDFEKVKNNVTQKIELIEPKIYYKLNILSEHPKYGNNLLNSYNESNKIHNLISKKNKLIDTLNLNLSSPLFEIKNVADLNKICFYRKSLNEVFQHIIVKEFYPLTSDRTDFKDELIVFIYSEIKIEKHASTNYKFILVNPNNGTIIKENKIYKFSESYSSGFLVKSLTSFFD